VNGPIEGDGENAPGNVRRRGLVIALLAGLVAVPFLLTIVAHPPRLFLRLLVIGCAFPVVATAVGLYELVTGRPFRVLARGFARLPAIAKVALTAAAILLVVAIAVLLFLHGLELATP
jgi:hypothetical protein